MRSKKQIWRGRQWVVTPTGMTTLNGSDYWIEKSRLGEVRECATARDDLRVSALTFRQDRNLSDWMLHMAEKNWVDIDDFIAAWCFAVAVLSVSIDTIDVAKSIRKARRENAAAKACDREHSGWRSYEPRVPLCR
jgi:hypothetical protein